MTFWNFRGPGKDDQLVTAIILICFLLSAGFFFWQRSITNNGLIDFEDIPTRHAEYLVDINQAEWPEFSNLPGIGEKLARQIVDFRELNGLFESADQLIQIKGIGESKLKAMRPHIIIGNHQSIVAGEMAEQP